MADAFRDRIVLEALTWLGTPYRHQASLRGVGCDCLGLVRGVWRVIYGSEPQDIPAYSSDWAEAAREESMLETARRHMAEIPVSEARAGDVLLFRWRPHMPAKHCGILTGEDRLVHAYDAAGKVAESNLGMWRRKIAGAFAFPAAET